MGDLKSHWRWGNLYGFQLYVEWKRTLVRQMGQETLSMGEQQRLALMALAVNPEVVLLDEP